MHPLQRAEWPNLMVTVAVLRPCRYRTEVGFGFPTNDFRMEVTASVTQAGWGDGSAFR